jgi:hypothetical protein
MEVGFKIDETARMRRDRVRLELGKYLLSAQAESTLDFNLPKIVAGRKIGGISLKSNTLTGLIDDVYDNFAVVYPDVPRNSHDLINEELEVTLDSEWSDLVDVAEGLSAGHLFTGEPQSEQTIVASLSSRYLDDSSLPKKAVSYFLAHKYMTGPIYRGLITEVAAVNRLGLLKQQLEMSGRI